MSLFSAVSPTNKYCPAVSKDREVGLLKLCVETGTPYTALAMPVTRSYRITACEFASDVVTI
jgi:hypothetical protein